jgi:hypothetical protein
MELLDAAEYFQIAGLKGSGFCGFQRLLSNSNPYYQFVKWIQIQDTGTDQWECELKKGKSELSAKNKIKKLKGEKANFRRIF